MCKTPITSALAERAVIPRGELRDLYSLLIQFTSGWDGMFTRACKTLRGARIHLPISPIRLTLAHHTSGQRVRNIVPCIQRWCWITSARHNCGAFISSGCWKSTLTDSALMLIPGVFLLFSQWYVKHLSQKLLTLMARGWFPPFRFIDTIKCISQEITVSYIWTLSFVWDSLLTQRKKKMKLSWTFNVNC